MNTAQINRYLNYQFKAFYASHDLFPIFFSLLLNCTRVQLEAIRGHNKKKKIELNCCVLTCLKKKTTPGFDSDGLMAACVKAP